MISAINKLIEPHYGCIVQRAIANRSTNITSIVFELATHIIGIGLEPIRYITIIYVNINAFE